MPQLRTLQKQLRRFFLPSSGSIGSTVEFRNAAIRERMRIYRNNSVLQVLLITVPHEQRQANLEILQRILNSVLTEIDTCGFTADGRVGVLLPDYAGKDAADLAEGIQRSCRQDGCHIQIEIVQFPDESIDSLTGKEETQGTRSRRKTPAATFFAIPTPLWKRTIDIFGASVGLVIAAPFIAVGALLVKMSSTGTALFLHQRTGQAGESFKIKKIRTMKMGAEKLVGELRHMSDRDGPAFKLNDDPRTLTVGKFLRKLSIDELPQLWNVLIGEMSLVGPRPLPLSETEELKLWHRERLDAKPGITGPWQVSGRNNISFEQWMQMDIDYVRNLSLLRDLKILLFTVPAVILCRGAS